MDAIKVLHVEDDLEFADLTSSYLNRKDERFHVDLAETPGDALTFLSRKSYDCIVSDFDLPQRNGIELLEDIRKDHPNIPFILYTGKGSEEIASDAISAGVTDYMQKEGSSEHFDILANKVIKSVKAARNREELRRSRELRRHTERLADTGGWETEIDTGENRWTAGLFEIFGIDYEEGVEPSAEEFFSYIHPKDRDWFREIGEKCVRFGLSYDEEVRILSEESETKWIRSRGEPVIESDEVVRFRGVAQDITESKEREEELMEQHALLNALMSGLPVGVLAGDEEQRVIAANQVFFDMFGLNTDLDEALGTDCSWIVDGINDLIDEDRTDAAIPEQRIDDNEAVNDDVLVLEDGRRIQRIYRPLDLGMDNGNLWVFIDEKEIQLGDYPLNNYYDFNDALDAGAVGTWEWYIPEDEIVTNREFAETFGVDPEEAEQGVSLERYVSSIHSGDRDRVEESIHDAVNECGDYHEEYRVWDINGELRWVSARGYVECDEEGTPQLFVGALTDITENREREYALQKRNERLDEFIRIISHDLKGPLNVAMGRLELAMEGDMEQLDFLADSLRRMERIIDDTVLLAKEGRDIGERKSVYLCDAIENAIRTSVDESVGADIDYSSCRGYFVEADLERLYHLLENLISNSVEYAGPEPTLVFEVTDNGFALEDDGPGIPPEEREKVFEAGYTTSDEGTGFGLGIVKRVAEAHGWSVSVSRGSLGGARFDIEGVRFVSS